jgi:hypothetical protein
VGSVRLKFILLGPCLHALRRLSRLEGQYVVSTATHAQSWHLTLPTQAMQSQMIGMQSSLDRILAAIQSQAVANGSIASSPMYPPRDGPGYVTNNVSGMRSQPDVYDPALLQDQRPGQRQFPPLPGFAPPESIFFNLLPY